MSVIRDRGEGFSRAFKEADYYEVPESIDVYSWSPDQAGSTRKATQVHLHFGEAPGPIFVVRFKSPRTLDKVIDMLVSHREDVWGKR